MEPDAHRTDAVSCDVAICGGGLVGATLALALADIGLGVVLIEAHPFGTSGLDLVPSTPPAGARWYLPWRYGRWRGVNGP